MSHHRPDRRDYITHRRQHLMFSPIANVRYSACTPDSISKFITIGELRAHNRGAKDHQRPCSGYRGDGRAASHPRERLLLGKSPLRTPNVPWPRQFGPEDHQALAPSGA